MVSNKKPFDITKIDFSDASVLGKLQRQYEFTLFVESQMEQVTKEALDKANEAIVKSYSNLQWWTGIFATVVIFLVGLVVTNWYPEKIELMVYKAFHDPQSEVQHLKAEVNALKQELTILKNQQNKPNSARVLAR